MSDSFTDACLAVEKPPPIGLPGVGSAFWRKEDPVLDEDGKIVKGGMWPHQRELWNLPNFLKALVGGYGSGKTNIGSKRIISLALQNAPCPVAAVSPTFAMARQTTIATIRSHLLGKQGIYGSKFWWKYNATTHEFRVKFHGREANILIYSGDTPDALKGSNLAAAWIDEPFIQERAVFDQILARIRHPDAVITELLVTGTPEQLNWGYDICIGEEKEKHNAGLVTASTRWNLALGADFISRLENTFTDKAADAFIEGKFVNLSKGQVYYAFERSVHVDQLETVRDNRVIIPDGVELGCGMDFNVNPMSAVVFWRQASHVHFFDEILLPNADTSFMATVLRDTYGKALTKLYPDASGSQRKSAAIGGKSDFWYLREAGYDLFVKSVNPERKDRYNAVNGKLKPKVGNPMISISPRCKNLIKYLELYSHELINKQEHMGHLLDAFSYPIAYLFPVVKEEISIHKLSGW